MRYRSTRGAAESLGFADVLLAGLATDGGLYVPTSWPGRPPVSGDYVDLAVGVMAPFVGDAIEAAAFADIVADAYATFDDPAVCPLRRLDDGHHLLELFHGPTLAFKDVALQLVGRLFAHELARRDERVMIVGATSGDTGSAAMEAVKGREDRHRRLVPCRPYERRPASADDHPRCLQRACGCRRGNVRRLPGPREGDVRGRAVPPAIGCRPSTRSTGPG
ncbi:MAG: hypothetical protein R2695_05065 [Acidimicrobiales bacterium]